MGVKPQHKQTTAAASIAAPTTTASAAAADDDNDDANIVDPDQTPRSEAFLGRYNNLAWHRLLDVIQPIENKH